MEPSRVLLQSGQAQHTSWVMLCAPRIQNVGTLTSALLEVCKPLILAFCQSAHLPY